MTMHTLTIIALGLGVSTPFMSAGIRLARSPKAAGLDVDDLLTEGAAHGLAVAILVFVFGALSIAIF